MPQDLWVAKEVADYLRLHEKVVYRLAKAGSIPSLKFGKRGVRFDPAVIKALPQRRLQGLSRVRARARGKSKVADAALGTAA